MIMYLCTHSPISHLTPASYYPISYAHATDYVKRRACDDTKVTAPRNRWPKVPSKIRSPPLLPPAVPVPLSWSVALAVGALDIGDNNDNDKDAVVVVTLAPPDPLCAATQPESSNG